METLILHYNYQRSLNDQYVHTKALANSTQQVSEIQAGFFLNETEITAIASLKIVYKCMQGLLKKLKKL